MWKFPVALAMACAFIGTAQAAGDADLAAIKQQIDELKKSYEQRIADLESKLAAADAKATRAEAQGASTRAASAPAPTHSGAGAFNPEISLILDAKYATTSRDPDTYRLRGFIPSGGEIGPPSRSFSLGETELAISSSVDHLFRGDVRFAVAGDGTGVSTEEANIETLALPAGLKLKAGRFLSGIGYLNVQHSHSWDFVDAPLVYKAMYGSRLSNDGAQLKWLAPTPMFLEVGAEVARGGGFPGSERNKNGGGLATLFAHIGGDVGTSNAWQAGVSYLRTAARDRSWDDVDAAGGKVSNAFTGRSTTWGADLVWKWAPNGNPVQNNFKFQSEYFQRRENGSLAYDDSAGRNAIGAASSGFRSTQSGWYAQAVWQFMPKWRVAYRRDQLSSGSLEIGLVDGGTIRLADLPILARFSPKRDSMMFDWSPSEFSRLRLQFARDGARGPGEADNQIFLQYVMSLGAHGAHKF